MAMPPHPSSGRLKSLESRVDQTGSLDAAFEQVQMMTLDDALQTAYQPVAEALGQRRQGVRCHVFISLTDGRQRAMVVNASANQFDSAWQAITAKLQSQLSRTQAVRWLRVDWVDQMDPHTWASLKKRLASYKRNYFRYGIALDPDCEVAFLEQEVNANAMLYAGNQIPVATLNHANFRRYAKQRYGRHCAPCLDDDRPVYTFTTQALLVEAGEPVRRLNGYLGGKAGRHTGRRSIDRLDAAQTYSLIDKASHFLANQVDQDGRFIYGIHPCFDREIGAYNTLRHASSIYSMLEAWEVTHSAMLKRAIDAALSYLTKELIHTWQHQGEEVAYLVEVNGEIKLGGSGVCLLTLTKYTELTGDERYLPLLEKLALGIRQLQDPISGRFTHVLSAMDLSVKETFRIIYYDGEAAFGLMRLYGLRRDERWLNVVERAFEYFIAQEHWKAHDHWLSYCVNELTLYRPDERYYRFGLQNVAGYLGFVEERITTFPTLLELMMAAHKMIRRLQASLEHGHLLQLIDLVHFYRALETRAHYLLNGHFWPEYAMFFKNPQRILGSFFIRHHSFRVRIDDVEHYLSGFVAFLQHYLADKVANKQSPESRQDDRRALIPEPAVSMPLPDDTFVAASNWSFAEIQRALPGKWLMRPSSPRWRATGLCISPKTMTPGQMVVVKCNDDEIGVPAALVHKLAYQPQLLIVQAPFDVAALAASGIPMLQVADTRQAVLQLGCHARERLSGQVVGITGSAGKTSSVALLRSLLSPWGAVGATRFSANLPHGIAWTLASVPWQAPFQIIEMAIGRMRQNSQLVRPNVALFLNVGPGHLEYHGTVDNVAVRKSRIFEAMRPGEHAIINRDMTHWSLVETAARQRGLRIISYGKHRAADIRWLPDERDEATIKVHLGGECLEVERQQQGDHWVMNLLGCLGVLWALGLPAKAVLPFVTMASPLQGRGERHVLAWGEGEIVLVNDAYNANPLSMAAMLSQAAGVRAKRKHLVLADMLELGDDSDAYHRALIAPIVASGAQTVWLLGDQMNALVNPLREESIEVFSMTTTQQLQQALLQALQAGDWVVFKGSNKFALGEVVQSLVGGKA